MLARAQRFVFGLALLLIPVALAHGVQSQDTSTPKDPRRALERFEEYLERKPYHDWAFDKLCEAAVSLNDL